MKTAKFRLMILTSVVVAFVCVFVLCLATQPAVTYAYAQDGDDAEIYYKGGGTFTEATETFTYATKTTETYEINVNFPNYYNANAALTNTCANAAGASVIGYYDRFYTDLIPNHTPGRTKNALYIYYDMEINAAKKQAVINDLYTRMETNVYREGTTQTQYKNGLASYVAAKGLTASYSSVVTNGSFDLAKAKAQFNNGNPISLFMTGYNFSTVTDENNQVTIQKKLFDSAHIANAYGYAKVRYFDANGNLVRELLYLETSTGFSEITGVYIVNMYGTLKDAESVHIE